MLDIVRNAIDQFYIQKNHKEFRTLCKKKLELFKELKDYVKEQNLTLKEGPDDLDAGRDWYIRVKKYEKFSFEITYNTILRISKISPLFYIYHEFEIENSDKKKMATEFCGYGNEPYSKKQAELGNKICSVLSKKGYQQLYKNDINESVPGFDMPDSVTILGRNVTLKHLLFIDVFDLCSKAGVSLK